MCAPPLDHGELIHHGHVCLSSMHTPHRILRDRKRATIAASFDERLANDTLSLSRSEQQHVTISTDRRVPHGLHDPNEPCGSRAESNDGVIALEFVQTSSIHGVVQMLHGLFDDKPRGKQRYQRSLLFGASNFSTGK
jgi:hypothetical protein